MLMLWSTYIFIIVVIVSSVICTWRNVVEVDRGLTYDTVRNVDKQMCYSYRGTLTRAGVCYCPSNYTFMSGTGFKGTGGRVKCRPPAKSACVTRVEFANRWNDECRVLDVVLWDMITRRRGIWREAKQTYRNRNLLMSAQQQKNVPSTNNTSTASLTGQLFKISFECAGHSSWVGCYLMEIPGHRSYPLTTTVLNTLVARNTSTSDTGGDAHALNIALTVPFVILLIIIAFAAYFMRHQVRDVLLKPKQKKSDVLTLDVVQSDGGGGGSPVYATVADTMLQHHDDDNYLSPINGQVDGVYYSSAQSPHHSNNNEEEESYWPTNEFDASPYSVLSASDNECSMQGRYDSSYYKTDTEYRTPCMGRKHVTTDHVMKGQLDVPDVDSGILLESVQTDHDHVYAQIDAE